MNPELKSKPDAVVAERDNYIDVEIEKLRNEYPDINKAEYWDALREAMFTNEVFLEMTKPLYTESPAGRSLADKEQRAALNDDLAKIVDLMDRKISLTPENIYKHTGISEAEAVFIAEIYRDRAKLAELFNDCDPNFKVTARGLFESLDQIYIFVPQPAESGEMNKYFRAESLGIPKLLTGALVLPEVDWLKIFPDSADNNDNEEPCSSVIGKAIMAEAFKPGSVFAKIGLSVIMEQSSSIKIEEVGRHEAVHQIDFMKFKREGISKLLTEVIAYRIDAKLDKPKNRKLNQDRFDNFIDENLDYYSEIWDLDKSRAKKIIDKSVAIINQLEKKVGFERVTAILLNCESFDELFKIASELEK